MNDLRYWITINDVKSTSSSFDYVLNLIGSIITIPSSKTGITKISSSEYTMQICKKQIHTL